jgi:hypothetical protein
MIYVTCQFATAAFMSSSRYIFPSLLRPGDLAYSHSSSPAAAAAAGLASRYCRRTMGRVDLQATALSAFDVVTTAPNDLMDAAPGT